MKLFESKPIASKPIRPKPICLVYKTIMLQNLLPLIPISATKPKRRKAKTSFVSRFL